jgi:hypothetical protein
VSDAIVIEANAEAIARVRMSHRADIMRFKALVMQLLNECEAEAADPTLFETSKAKPAASMFAAPTMVVFTDAVHAPTNFAEEFTTLE